MTEQTRKICFVISPIGDKGSETADRSDQVFNFIIQPIAQECGYDAVRADQIDKPGVITSQIISHILADPLVIADLTGYNPNVFYELALCHAFRRPVVQIMQEGHPLPFDVAGQRTVFLDHKHLGSVDQAKKKLTAQIKAVEKDPGQVDNPITAAVTFESLRGSSEPMQKTVIEILDMVRGIRGEVSELSNRLPGDINRMIRHHLSPPDIVFRHGQRTIRSGGTILRSFVEAKSPDEVAGSRRVNRPRNLRSEEEDEQEYEEESP